MTSKRLSAKAIIASLREARLDRRLTQQEVADRSTMLTRSKIAKYESGLLATLPIGDLLDWCEALEVPLAAILRGSTTGAHFVWRPGQPPRRTWMVTRRWVGVEAERATDALEAAEPGEHQSAQATEVGDAEPVFELIVMSDGKVIINNDQRRPVADIVTLLRQVADGFESGQAKRAQ